MMNTTVGLEAKLVRLAEAALPDVGRYYNPAVGTPLLMTEAQWTAVSEAHRMAASAIMKYASLLESMAQKIGK
jgi:hypothetical protein